MSRSLRLKVWYYINLGLILAIWIALKVTINVYDETFLEVIFSNYTIPLVAFVSVLVSILIKDYEEQVSLLFILLATYVHLTPGIEKNPLITYMVLIVFPIFFLIRAVQFIKRKGIRDVQSYIRVLLCVCVYVYLVFRYLG
jgi:hypothetical protein